MHTFLLLCAAMQQCNCNHLWLTCKHQTHTTHTPADERDEKLHAPGGHIQGRRAPPGSNLPDRASTGSAHAPGGHSINQAQTGGTTGIQGSMTIAETMMPTGKLPKQALAPDGRERTTFQPFLDILVRLKNV